MSGYIDTHARYIDNNLMALPISIAPPARFSGRGLNIRERLDALLMGHWGSASKTLEQMGRTHEDLDPKQWKESVARILKSENFWSVHIAPSEILQSSHVHVGDVVEIEFKNTQQDGMIRISVESIDPEYFHGAMLISSNEKEFGYYGNLQLPIKHNGARQIGFLYEWSKYIPGDDVLCDLFHEGNIANITIRYKWGKIWRIARWVSGKILESITRG